MEKSAFQGQKNSFYEEQRSFSLKIGIQVSFSSMVSTSQKLGIKEYYLM